MKSFNIVLVSVLRAWNSTFQWNPLIGFKYNICITSYQFTNQPYLLLCPCLMSSDNFIDNRVSVNVEHEELNINKY